MKYLLKNGTVISGAGTRKQDVLVEGEKIIKVGEELSQPDAKVVDVSGKLLFPGFIDGHTHFDLEVAGTVTADVYKRQVLPTASIALLFRPTAIW